MPEPVCRLARQGRRGFMNGTETRKYVVEFIGTFVLVLTVGCTVLGHADLAPLAYGASLMIMVYAGSHISGGHYNPAVSLAAYLRGRLSSGDLIRYWVAQLLAGFVAAFVAQFLINPAVVSPLSLTGRGMPAALVGEFLFTFALAFVVLNVTTSRSQPDNAFYGLAIGFTVFAGAAALGGVSGGIFNPAVAFGATIMGLLSWQNIWIYLFAELVGGAAAAYLVRYLSPADALA